VERYAGIPVLEIRKVAGRWGPQHAQRIYNRLKELNRLFPSSGELETERAIRRLVTQAIDQTRRKIRDTLQRETGWNWPEVEMDVIAQILEDEGLSIDDPDISRALEITGVKV